MFKLFQTQIDNLNVHTQPSKFKHKRAWAQDIKSLLDKFGFSQLWLNQYVEIPCYEVNQEKNKRPLYSTLVC